MNGFLTEIRTYPVSGWVKSNDNTYCPAIYYYSQGNDWHIAYIHPSLGKQILQLSTPPIFSSIGQSLNKT